MLISFKIIVRVMNFDMFRYSHVCLIFRLSTTCDELVEEYIILINAEVFIFFLSNNRLRLHILGGLRCRIHLTFGEGREHP